MIGQLVIHEQNYPTSTGETPLTYAVMLETSETFEGIEHWQDMDLSLTFLCYSWTRAGAERAIEELRRLL